MNKSQFNEHEIVWDDSKISALWDYYSRTYPYSQMYFSKIFGGKILKKSGLNLKKGLRVLDYGCGPGYIWEHINELCRNWRYTGIDFSMKSIDKILKKKDGETGQNIFETALFVQQLPTTLNAAEYDLVLLIEVVEHLNDKYLDGAISEIKRVIKKDGLLLITTPNAENLELSKKFCPDCGAIFHEWQHVRMWDIDTLNKFMLRNSFELVRYSELDFTSMGFSIKAAGNKMKRIIKKIIRKDYADPHLISLYRKINEN
jgi:SAM-dependent methyltransferase